MKRLIFILTILAFGCASHIPEEEMMLAQVAIEAAKEAKADVLSPRNFQRAEDFLRAAKKAKEDRDYGMAKHLALQAKSVAEKAEDEAVLKQEQNKDISEPVTEPEQPVETEKESQP